MTLMETLPSLRRATVPSLSRSSCLDVWPTNTHFVDGGRMSVAGVPLGDIADQYGTAVHVFDEDDFRLRARRYQAALSGAEIAYAADALLTKTIAGWVGQEGMSLSVASCSEVAVALAGGIDAARMILRGNGRSCADLRYAVAARIGRIVVGSYTEIALLSAQLSGRQRVLLRIESDGTGDGFDLGSGRLVEAARRILEDPHLELVGLAGDIGCHTDDPDIYGRLIESGVAALGEINREFGTQVRQLSIGGGELVASRFGDRELDVTSLASTIDDALERLCSPFGDARPHIIVEPGRAIAAHAGVTVYRIVGVRHADCGIRIVIDADSSGGRGSGQYVSRTVSLVNRHPSGPVRPATVVGRDARDEVARDVLLPNDIHPGDLVALACTGADLLSPASGGRLSPRPPIIAVADGRARQIMRRETVADLMARDLG